MIQGALWITGLYLLAAMSVHLIFKRWAMTDRRRHYVLITKDNQQQIEGVLRSLLLHYWLRGKQVRITVVDEGSVDETMKIASLLSRSEDVAVRREPEPTAGIMSLEPNEDVIRIRLNQLEDVRKIPLCP